ncbi:MULTISPECIES: hydroxymethylbilane synthase [Spirosoma]|uniref:Hydroxymethylbilane synthase n=1 Tax=Spirosoma liriopis TaxID=2937440 RepID=A0ABT0HJL3_9BACT|nr:MULTISPECIES: hydroxymethylbilane synthase [Spirosoma]MCK8492354.1 hydroxymethylbilane synthase [Spirosoma liriopis]UHG91827.1 hydroxymethylbilane synthase [Spirosoma oryzicola]
MHIRIGTRTSRLALWQAEHIQALLQAGGLTSELVLIDTKGDKVLDRSLSKIGSKGVFTQELEEQLWAGSIDIAVHSAKDLPSSLPTGLSIISFTERELTNDVLISRDKSLSLTNGREFTIGTSSTRRVAMLKHFCPHVTTVDMRGNLQTRLRKLDEGQCDALLLAYAGVHRMGYDDLIVEHLPIADFTPAVGQGSIAIEAAETLAIDKTNAIRQLTNHSLTESCLRAERAFLARLEGGCSIPSFALAQWTKEQTISLSGGLVSLDGSQLLRETFTGTPEQATMLGHELAETILGRGGDVLLTEIRAHL